MCGHAYMHLSLSQTFARFDKDNSNTIEVHEIMDELAARGVRLDNGRAQEIIEQLDEDGSGTIDIGEFLRWKQVHGAEELDDKSDEQVCLWRVHRYGAFGAMHLSAYVRVRVCGRSWRWRGVVYSDLPE